MPSAQMADNDFYPPAPANVPPEITRPDAAYRLRVAAMIAALLGFLLLYAVIVVLSGLFAYWLVMLPLPKIGGRGLIFLLILKFGGAFAAILLWLFLLKGLFKGRRVERSKHLILKDSNHPELFEFIRQVYRDTGSPPPRRVYVSPDVNAALVYDTSLINLVIPPRKDLLIGLGLVNVVDLAEFKAVLAHEFGHFAQRSVGLGSYLYVANRIMSDVIYGRDGFDRFVDDWSRQDIRISFPAWGLKGALWIVRKMLSGAYESLNLLHLSLARQMEFNADNVAVSVTGSDALIHGLARLEFATECMADAAQSLNAAADHGLFSDDLFHHHSLAIARLRKLRNDDRLGLPPVLPKNPSKQVQVFKPVHDGIPDRYQTHPTHHMRESNAKRFYVRSPIDERSPWMLFGKVAKLKRTVTERFYRRDLDRTEEHEPTPAAEVQQFIDAEHAESTCDPKYHGFYDDRFINPGDLQRQGGKLMTRDALDAWLSTWPGDEVALRMETFRERKSERQLLCGLKSGELSLAKRTFTFRGGEYSRKDVDRLFAKVERELDDDSEELQRWDREVFVASWSLSRFLDETDDREIELLERYRFHMQLQELLQRILGGQSRLQAVFAVLSQNTQLAEEDFRAVVESLETIRGTIESSLKTAERLATPALANVPAGSSLHSLVADRGETSLPPLGDDRVSAKWVNRLVTRLDGVLTRMKRLHFKSLGRLLAFQEKLADDWRQRPLSRDEPPQES